MARISAEALLLNALINSQDVEAAQRFGITVDHFRSYGEHYRWLQQALKKYNRQPSRHQFEAAFPDFPYSDHDDVRSACDLVLDRFYQTALVEGMDRASKLLGSKDVRGAWEALQACEPTFTSAPPRSIVTDLTFLDTYDDIQEGIDLPVPTLQRVTGGIKAGQLWYVGARTNHGKSAHLCAWAAKAMVDGEKVKFFSLEMTENEIRARVHAILAHKFRYDGITSFGILHRTVDRHLYKQFISELGDKCGGDLSVHTPDMGYVTPGTIASCIADYDLVFVDHVGLMRPDGNGHATDDWRVVAKVSNSLKEIALSSLTPIVAAAQINREGDRGKQPPDVKNLAGSDSLGQDADVVVTMRAMAKDVATACALPKNRHGPKAKWWTRFDVNNGDFHEITVDQADDLEMEAENAD